MNVSENPYGIVMEEAENRITNWKPTITFNPKKGRKIMSSTVLKRDVTGKCDEGECRDRVSEGNKARKVEIEKEGVESPESYPAVPGAEKLENPDNPAAGIPGRGK